MRLVLQGVLLLLGASFQMILMPQMPIVLCLAVLVAVHASHRTALWFACAAALLHDALCPAPLWVSLPLFAGVVELVFRVRTRFYSDRLLSYAILGGCAAFLLEWYLWWVFSFSGLRPTGVRVLFLRPALAFLFGMVCAPLVSLLVLPIKRFLTSGRAF